MNARQTAELLQQNTNEYAAGRVSVPAQHSPALTTVGEFLGVDFTSSPANVDPRRSPWAVNMVRDEPGKVRKSMGYEKVGKVGYGRINGVHYMQAGTMPSGPVVHVGSDYHKMNKNWDQKDAQVDKVLYVTANNHASSSFQLGGRMYVLDGRRMLEYDPGTNEMVAVEKKAYVPTVFIGRAAGAGALGGRAYESLNLLSSNFKEEFLGNGKDTVYQLSFAPLDAHSAVRVQQMLIVNGVKTWMEMVSNGYSVNYAVGQVVFHGPPPVSPVTGEDNVRIQAQRTIPNYAQRINKCDVGVLFGIRGTPDRLFVTGNTDAQFRNVDWFSAQNDATYFPDVNYTVYGSTDSAVMGYSILGDKLALHKDAYEKGRNIFVREGTMNGGVASFPVSNTLQGVGVVAKKSFATLAGEPVFLTGLGIYAVTTQDVTGEKYAQNRSFYLNGRLLAEQNPEKAAACVFKDMYLLCLNGYAYILDGLQPVAPEASAPYSTRQYAGFLRSELGHVCSMWQREGRLFFGDEFGNVYRFFDDPNDSASYYDLGQPIVARWETPDFDARVFQRKKTFRRVFLRMAAALQTGVRVFGKWGGVWQLLEEDQLSARYMSFGTLDFGKFTFSGDQSPRVVSARVGAKRVENARFAFENARGGEPFKLHDIRVESRENGEVR